MTLRTSATVTASMRATFSAAGMCRPYAMSDRPRSSHAAVVLRHGACVGSMKNNR
jgi:hypothetical protein